MKLVTRAQMRELEQAGVAAGVSLGEMMESAGLAVAQEAWLLLGVIAGRRVLVLAGPGNNGGDGLVAARHLADWEADVAVYTPAPRPPDDAHVAALADRNVPIFDAADDPGYARLDEALAGAELVVDALLGIGSTRPLDGPMSATLERLAAARARNAPAQVVAVDIPTGVDADSGRADPLAVHADITVTFGASKVGLHTLPGSRHAGRIQVIDIGIPGDAECALPVELASNSWVRDRLPARPAGANKGTFGRVMAVAGSENYPGAARLCAEAAYRAGAGLVTIASARHVRDTVAASLPEATYLVLDDLTDPSAQIADALRMYDVLLIGPGIGRSEQMRDRVISLLARAPVNIAACVVDADALNEFAAAATPNPGGKPRLPTVLRPSVLTPHPGEMARLLGTSVEAVQADRLNLAIHAAGLWQHIVVLKGAHTVTAAPDGRAIVNPHANPLLAVAGTGDVLAGVIAGLLAQGAPPFEAAACGVYVHGLAAETRAGSVGDRGMVASELAAAIPVAIREIREGKRMIAPTRGGIESLVGLGQFGSREPPEA